MQYLTGTKVNKAKAREKAFKLTDGGGMYLHVASNGSKLWRYQYRFNGKAKLLAIGIYPDVSLAQARERHQEARKLVAEGIDPMADRRARKEAENVTTFETVFHKWFEFWKEGKAEKHIPQVLRRAQADILPAFGAKPIDDVTAADVRKMMITIAGRGAKDVARRAHETTSQVYRYAVSHDLAKRNPAADFKPSDIIARIPVKNFARVSEKDLPALLKKMDEYDGTAITKLAMRLLAFTFVRTKELIGAEWTEFDFDRLRWDIPKDRMKGKKAQHIVPLSHQSIEVLKALKMLTGRGRLVFPGDLDKNKSMSNNTILKALERMGYKGVMTGHGFRGLASTILHEQGYEHDHVELQLAHLPRNGVSAAYNHALYLEPRTRMMQDWADYLTKQWK
jgi:integrase